MGNVSVVQVMTSGRNGFPKDTVIQVGVVEVDTCAHELIDESLISVGIDIGSLPHDKRDFIGHSLTADDFAEGMPITDAAEELRSILKGKEVTSYDVRNTFSRYLVFEPWDLTYDVMILPSVSARMPNNLIRRDVSDENVCIENAYRVLLKGYVPEKKDALAYARMTSELMMFMRDRGQF